MPSIFCLEGEWKNMRSRESVVPYLDLLERLDYATYVHRDVATIEEFDYYIQTLKRSSAKTYPVLFLASHGSSGKWYLRSDVSLTLEDLGERLEGRMSGRVVHFGGCSIARAKPERLTAFAEKTDARAVTGYSKVVDWLSTAAFEMVLLAEMMNAKRPETIHRRIVTAHPLWSKELGFVVADAKQVWTG
jgi:hypothetical protein